jgi:hypothetical protein
MSKHHLKSMAEQIDNTGHASAPFHYGNEPYQASAAMSEDVQAKVEDNESSIKLRAYQIHLEKGGSDLDNWLEAERSLSKKNGSEAVS